MHRGASLAFPSGSEIMLNAAKDNLLGVKFLLEIGSTDLAGVLRKTVAKTI